MDKRAGVARRALAAKENTFIVSSWVAFFLLLSELLLVKICIARKLAWSREEKELLWQQDRNRRDLW